MLADFISVKKIIEKKIFGYLRDQTREQLGPYFKEVPQRTIFEGNQLKQNYEDSKSHSEDIATLEASTTIDISEALKNHELVFKHLDTMAKQWAEQQTKHMLKSISNITEETGNVVKGTSLSAESLLATWEAVQIPFDENDEPILPSILCGHDTMNKMYEIIKDLHSDSNYKEKFDKIIEQKRKEWHDRENSRKLAN